MQCPNCGQTVEEGKALCPNCGADVPVVWPPAPLGQQPTALPLSPEQVRQEIVSGLNSGCMTELATYFTLAFFSFAWVMYAASYRQRFAWHLFCFGIPALVVSIRYWRVRFRRPFFARGLGYSLLITLACLLGALTVCLYR